MTYTDKQIEIAKYNYNNFLVNHTLNDYDVECIGVNEAERRIESHNKTVSSIKNGNKSLEKEWKTFFLNEVVKAERKHNESKLKLATNKANSSDILAPIKEIKKLVEFGKWLNTPKNPFRKEHFNKKYSTESVNTFLSL
jgi:hypothetical protein